MKESTLALLQSCIEVCSEELKKDFTVNDNTEVTLMFAPNGYAHINVSGSASMYRLKGEKEYTYVSK